MDGQITAALKTAELILDTVRDMGDPLYYPLWHATVVAYARPFTRNRPYGALPSKWGRFTDKRLQATHETLIADRDKLVAHSDADVRRVQIAPPGIYFGDFGPNAGIGVSIFAGGYELDYFQRVYDVCYDLGFRLNREVEELLELLYGGMDLPLAPFDLRMTDGL